MSSKKEGLTITDENWTDYVLGELRDNEKVVDDNGNVFPKAVGLLRFCQEKYGDITYISVDPLTTPTDDNLRSSVVAKISIKRYSDDAQIHFEEVADTDVDSLGEVFKPHLTPTASTRAQGRVLKKLLFLNCYTSEEMGMVNSQSNKSSSNNSTNTGLKMQIITNLIEKHKLDKDDIAKRHDIKSWSKAKISKLEEIIEELNKVDLAKG